MRPVTPKQPRLRSRPRHSRWALSAAGWLSPSSCPFLPSQGSSGRCPALRAVPSAASPRGRLPPSPWLTGGALPASSLPNPRGHRHRSRPCARFVQPPRGARPGWRLILCTQSVDVKHRSPSRPCVRWVGAALSHRRVRPPGCRSPNRGADTQARGQDHSVSLEKPQARQAGRAAHPSSGSGASPGFLPWLFAGRPLSPGDLGSCCLLTAFSSPVRATAVSVRALPPLLL